jgi:ATP-dependent Clp protease ATP-binding subunit ClpA
MMFERFTRRARTAVRLAQHEARALGQSDIGPEHLLLAMLADADCLAAKVLFQLGIDRSTVVRELAPNIDGDADVLRAIGIDLDEVRRRAEEIFGPGALDRPASDASAAARRGAFMLHRRGSGGQSFADEAKAALGQALRAAVELGDDYIGTEHLLLGVLADEQSAATRVLRRLGMTLDQAGLRARITEELGRAA